MRVLGKHALFLNTKAKEEENEGFKGERAKRPVSNGSNGAVLCMVEGTVNVGPVSCMRFQKIPRADLFVLASFWSKKLGRM